MRLASAIAMSQGTAAGECKNHTNFRKASADWITRRAWTDHANRGSAWSDVVAAASPQQLCLFGFPPPGHAYWTDATLKGLAQRYPGFDPAPWR